MWRVRAGVHLLSTEQVCPGRGRGGTIPASEDIQAKQSGHRGGVMARHGNASCWVSHGGVFSQRISSVAAEFMTLLFVFLLLFSFLRSMFSCMSLILSTYRVESCLGGVTSQLVRRETGELQLRVLESSHLLAT